MAEAKGSDERSLIADDDSDSDDSDFLPGRPASSSGSDASSSSSSNSSDSDSDSSGSEQTEKEKEKKKKSASSGSSDSSSSDSSTSDGESSADSDDDEHVQTEEAVEAAAQQQFRTALLSLVEGDVDEAFQLLDDLLHSPLLQKFHPRDIDDYDWSIDPPAYLSAMSRLFCAVNKNLATICSDADQPFNAIGYLLNSLTIERSSVSMWHQLGLECVKANHLGLANFAFRQGLKLEADNFECLDKLICVLYLSADYSSCLCFIKQAFTLQDSYIRGLVLKESIVNSNPYLREQTKSWFPDPEFEITPTITDDDRQSVFAKLQPLLDRQQQELTFELSKPNLPFKPETVLSGFDWSSFGTSLCRMYEEMEDIGIAPTRYVNLSEWVCAIEEEQKRRLTKDATAINSQPLAMDEEQSLMEVSAASDSVNMSLVTNCSAVIDDSIAIRTVVDTLVDSVVDQQEISKLLNELITNVEALDRKKPQKPLSAAAAIVKRHRRSSMRGVALTATSDSDSGDAAGIYKRRSSRLVPGFSIEDNFLNAAKPVPLTDLLQSFLPKSLTAHYGQRTPSKSVLAAKEKAEAGAADGDVLPKLDDLQEASDEELQRIAQLLLDSRDTSLVDVLKRFLLAVQAVTLTHRLSNGLRSIFVDCYERWRPHIQFKSPLDAVEDGINMEGVVENGWLHLTAAELYLTINNRSETVWNRKASAHVSYLSRFVAEFGVDYAVRAHCLLASARGVTAEDECWHLGAAQSLLQQSVGKQLVVPNAPLQLMSEAAIEARLRRLEQATTLASVGQLFEQEHFERVATLLVDTWHCGWSTAPLEAQATNCVLLVRSLAKIGKVSDCVHWAAKALTTLLHLLTETHDSAMHWKQISQVIKSLDDICTSGDLKKTSAVDDGDLQSLASSLIKLIALRLDWGHGPCPLSIVSPWIVLYTIASRADKELLRMHNLSERYRSAGNSKVVLATDSLMILRTAHAKLGERGQCLAEGGRLLLFLVEELRNTMQHPHVHELVCAKDARFKGIKDYMLNEAEQCFFCLYKFPTKRKRHLLEHKSAGLELTWKHAGAVFEFVLPDKHEIPAFDDVISNLISSDAVQLLQRISKLVPKTDRPDSLLAQFDSYVGNMCRLGDDWPVLDGGSAAGDRWIVGEMYYLMGDYCFKTGDFSRAIEHYRRHLIVAGRSDHSFNSWGGCALAGAAVLSSYLQHCDNFATHYAEMKRLSTATLFAFETALSLNPSHRILHTEFADVAYQLRAHLVRGIRTLGLDDSRRNEIKQRCAALLSKAKEHFESALNLIGQDGAAPAGSESWLCRYFLGKIGEKEGASPAEVLSNYHRSAVLMMRDGARYSDRINYKPKRYELESLEVHYRVHAAVIKWLTKREKWPLEDLRVMLRHLQMFTEHGVCRLKAVDRNKSVGWFRFHEDPEIVATLDSAIDQMMVEHDQERDAVEAVVADMVDCVTIKELLFQMCIEGMKLCIRRFQNHFYKAFYRLAQCYFRVDCVKNVKRASIVLFGPVSRKEMGIASGLFQSRKPTNFFENLWRIPVEEIDRNGSFPIHMARCCRLAIAVAATLDDYTALLDMVVPLSRKPTDPKLQYVSELNRKELCVAASRCGLQAARRWLSRSRPDMNLKKFCMHIYQAVRQLVKNKAPLAEAWTELLRDAFCRQISLAKQTIPNLDALIHEKCEAWIAQSVESKRANSIAHRFNSAAAKRQKMQESEPTTLRHLQKQLKRALPPSDDQQGASSSTGAVGSSAIDGSSASKIARSDADEPKKTRFSVDELLGETGSDQYAHRLTNPSMSVVNDRNISTVVPPSSGSIGSPIFLDE